MISEAGPSTADVRAFKDIGPAADGKLHLKFEAFANHPLLSAIEITPGVAGKLQPIRMIALDRAYADKQGRLQDTPQRAYLSVIDGILGGHREGPLHPTAKECGLLIGGTDPIAVDVVCSHIMGFDPERIRLLSESYRARFALGTADPDMIEVSSNEERWTRWREPDFHHLAFEPSGGWRGYVERSPGRSVGTQQADVKPRQPAPAGL